MVRVGEGDREAFRLLVERYKDSLVNYLSKIAGNRERAEDFAQDTFLRLFTHAHNYQERGQLVGYLFRIATNLVRSEGRRTQRWRLLSDRYAHEPRPRPLSQERGLLGEEATSRVSAALETLPHRYRAPLVLREIEGLSYRDIAQALGLKEGTIKSRISRGKEKLRLLLEPYWQEVSS